MRILIAVLVLFAIAACQKEAGDGLDQVKGAAGELAGSAEKLASSVENLGKDKVQEMGKIAALIETAPAKAEQMLKDLGMSRADFDKMVAKIKDNDELNKIFEAAKNLAKKEAH